MLSPCLPDEWTKLFKKDGTVLFCTHTTSIVPDTQEMLVNGEAVGQGF